MIPAFDDHFDAAQEKYGCLGLNKQEYKSHLMKIIKRITQKYNKDNCEVFKPSKLYYSDLYLTIACGCNYEKAWNCLVKRYMSFVIECFQRVISDKITVQELTCNLFSDLYSSSKSGKKLVLSYEGRCQLKTWLRSIVNNRAINEKQLKWNSMIFIDSEYLIADYSALKEIQLNILRKENSQLAHECLQIIRRNLSPDERLILFMRYNLTLPLSNIANYYNVHQSTITRRIKNIQIKLNNIVSSHLANMRDIDSNAMMETIIHTLEFSDHSLFDFI